MKKSLKLIAFLLFVLLLICYVLAYLGIGNKSKEEAPYGQFVRIHNQDIRYIEAGDGPDVLLIHGTPGSIEDMKMIFDSLVVDHRVIAYDRPGHGFSSSTDIPYNLEHNARIAESIIDHFKMDSVKVIGHSYGGCIAMQMATEGHESVDRFYILGSPLFSVQIESVYKLFNIPVLKTLLSFMTSGLYAKNKISNQLPNRFASVNRGIADPSFVNFRIDLWSQPKVILSKSLETVNIESDINSIRPQYDQLKNEVTIIMGLEDIDHYITDLKKALPLPKVKTFLLHDVGHFVQFEAINEVLSELRKD